MIALNSSRLAVVLALLVVPLSAHAEAPSAPPTEEQVEAARALFRDARELHRQGKLKEAIERALESYRAAATPVTAVESGQLLVEAGRLVEARDIVRSVSLIPVSPRESEKGREARQEASSMAASLDTRIPKLAVAERPRGVDVLLDGKLLPASEGAAWLGVDPGAHSLVVRADDRACKTISVSLGEGDTKTIDLHDVPPGCRVEVAPPSAEPSTQPAAIARAAPPPDAPSPKGGDDLWHWTGAAIAGAGAVAIGVGGYLALSAKGDYDSVASECHPKCTRNAYDVRQSARTRADWATGTLIAGGVAVATGGFLYLFVGKSRASESARAWLTFGASTVRLTMRF